MTNSKCDFDYYKNVARRNDIDVSDLLVDTFKDYLEKSKDWHLKGYALKKKTGGAKDSKEYVKEYDFGYPHRWSESYIKSRFAKLYQLDEWYQKHNPAITFMSIALKHPSNKEYSCLTIDEIINGFEDIQNAKRDLFHNYILKDYPHLNYVEVIEPHKNGYPHCHFLIFSSIKTEDQIKYRKLMEKWEYGSFENSIDFDERPDSEIKSLVNYLMKYMNKSLPGVKSKFKENKWTEGMWLFNAVAWAFKYRTWCSSKELSKVMAYQKYERPWEDWELDPKVRCYEFVVTGEVVTECGLPEYEGYNRELVGSVKDRYDEEHFNYWFLSSFYDGNVYQDKVLWGRLDEKLITHLDEKGISDPIKKFLIPLRDLDRGGASTVTEFKPKFNRHYIPKSRRFRYKDRERESSLFKNSIEEFLSPRPARGIHDLLYLGIIPKINCYRKDLVPGDVNLSSALNLKADAVLLSHAHMDHAGNIGLLDTNIPVVASPMSAAILKAMMDCGNSS